MLSTLFVSVALVSHVTAFASSLTRGYTELISSGCSTSGPASCQNTTTETDSCCFEAPGGQILQVQFWDTDPSTGPADSWTIHGLWPDNCDGTYVEDCDPSRDYDDISTLLQDNGASSTYEYMQTYWVSDDESNEDFWEHEWATHGTCYSTLNPSCLPSGSPTGLEAVAFFETAVTLFQNLTTYQFLENQGITPGSQTYSYSDLADAIKAETGYIPSLDCEDGAVYQISYYYNLKGSMIDGDFVPIDAPEQGSCSSSGITYPAKSSSDSDVTTSPAIRRARHARNALRRERRRRDL